MVDANEIKEKKIIRGLLLSCIQKKEQDQIVVKIN